MMHLLDFYTVRNVRKSCCVSFIFLIDSVRRKNTSENFLVYQVLSLWGRYDPSCSCFLRNYHWVPVNSEYFCHDAEIKKNTFMFNWFELVLHDHAAVHEKSETKTVQNLSWFRLNNDHLPLLNLKCLTSLARGLLSLPTALIFSLC